MDMAEDISTVIQENAEGPLEVSGDSSRRRQHSIPDQIAADKYLKEVAAQRASRKPAIRMHKIDPGSAV